MNRKFPDTRLRRLRSNPSLLKITAETSLTVDDLIQPIFVKEGIKKAEAIESMPNVNRHSKEGVIDYCKSLMDLGIKAVALFPVIDSKKKDLEGIEAFNRKNLICGTVESIKKKITSGKDLFKRKINYKKINIDNSFPNYIVENKEMFKGG